MSIFKARLSKTTIAFFVAALAVCVFQPFIAAGLFFAGLLFEWVGLFSAARDAKRQEGTDEQKRPDARPAVRASDAAASPSSIPKPEDQRLIRRFVQNIDLPLLFLSPAVSAYGLAYSDPPLSGWLLYLGIVGFGAALIMNHLKHKRKRELS